MAQYSASDAKLEGSQAAHINQYPPALSPREFDVVRLLARGLSRDEVAYQLNISSSTVRVYIDNARQKLQGRNVLNSIYIASKKGII